jgi:hypothetical protein
VLSKVGTAHTSVFNIKTDYFAKDGINHLIILKFLIDLGNCLSAKYFHIQIIVKVGIKSVPGKISSTKLKIPPKAPFHPPKVLKKIIAEIGAQIISPNSPIPGIA